MISPDLLKILRCPLDPNTELDEEENHLKCQRCQVRFPIRDGFPTMLIEEATLPNECSSIEQLPCQQQQPSS